MAECVPESNGYIFLWKIENALLKNDCFQSPTFVTSKLGRSKWRLKLKILETQEYMLALEIEKIGGMSEITIELSFHLITLKGPICLKNIQEKFYTQDTSIMCYIEKAELKSMFEDGSVYTTNDTLTLNCLLGNCTNPLFPPVILSGLTQCEVEKHTFKQSFYYTKSCPENLCDKVITPKSENMPHIKVSVSKNDIYSGIKLSVSCKLFNVDIKYNYKVKMSTSIFDINNRLLKSANESKLFSQWDNSYCTRILLQIRKLETMFTMNFDLTICSNRISSQINEFNDPLDLDCVTIGQHIKEEDVKVNHVPVKAEIHNTSHTGLDFLMDDLKLLLSEKQFCDISFKINGKEFLAHKNILSIRSPVFNTMFGSDMKEKQTGVVHIDDIDPDTFEHFLHYLYLGKLKNLNEENAVNLYSVADKYQVKSLKNECSSYILDHLSAENVCDVLILSDMHQDEGMKKAAQKVFCIYSKTVLLSKDWASLLEKRLHLAAATLREMALNMQ